MSDSRYIEGKTILVVDDEPDILEALEELLDVCTVVKADSFEAAKQLLLSQKFDAAVLDIMGVRGYDLLEIANRQNIPALILTANAFSQDNLVRTIKEGGCSYIPKEKISDIERYIADVLRATSAGDNPWGSWQQQLPSSYFEKRWGAAWKDVDRDFWNRFKASIKKRS